MRKDVGLSDALLDKKVFDFEHPDARYRDANRNRLNVSFPIFDCGHSVPCGATSVGEKPELLSKKSRRTLLHNEDQLFPAIPKVSQCGSWCSSMTSGLPAGGPARTW